MLVSQCQTPTHRGRESLVLLALWHFTGGLVGKIRVIVIQLLTLGVHAQRGFLYLVCVSLCVCVCVSVCLSPLILALQDQAGSSVIPTALAQQGIEKLCGDFA